MLLIVGTIVVTAADVFAELAAGLVLAPLAAAPPHFAPELGQVNPAGPVEVLGLHEVFVAIFARFRVDRPLALRKLRHFLLHLLLVCLHFFDLALELVNLFFVDGLALGEQLLLLE